MHGPLEGLLRHAYSLGEGSGLKVEAGEGDDKVVPRTEGLARVRHGMRCRFRRGEDPRPPLSSPERKTDCLAIQVKLRPSVPNVIEGHL